MARTARGIEPKDDVHTIFRSVDNSFLFLSNEAKNLFLKTLSRMKAKHKSRIYAWVGMSNHNHIFNQAPDYTDQDLKVRFRYTKFGNMMRDCFSIFARRFNRQTHRIGGVIRDRTTTVRVFGEHQSLTLLVYIFLNPVRAGIVKHPRNYPHHNYSMYATGKTNPKHEGVFSFHPAYLALGKSPVIRRAKFLHLIEKALKTWGLNRFRGISASQGPGRDRRKTFLEDFQKFSKYWIPEKFGVGRDPP